MTGQGKLDNFCRTHEQIKLVEEKVVKENLVVCMHAHMGIIPIRQKNVTHLVSHAFQTVVDRACIPRSCVQGFRLGENKGWDFFRVNFAFISRLSMPNYWLIWFR